MSRIHGWDGVAGRGGDNPQLSQLTDMGREYYEIPIAIRSQTTRQTAAFSGNQSAAAPQIASQWGAAYERQSDNEIVCVDLGTFTYGFDIAAERLVYVIGTTGAPQTRDRSRQQGSPKPSEKDDEKGHVIATSLGGGMDINLIPQARSVNRGKGSRWASIERELAKRPGSVIAIHLIYSDDSQRPASFEFGYESDSGFRVEHIDNLESS